MKLSEAQVDALARGRAKLGESRQLWREGRGLLESYQGGLLEIRPDEDEAYWWQITGLYLPSGEAFQPSPRLYRTHTVAIAVAQRLFDWLLENQQKIEWWGAITPDGCNLHRQTEKDGRCELPYINPFFYKEQPLIVIDVSAEARSSGWAEAQLIDQEDERMPWDFFESV